MIYHFFNIISYFNRFSSAASVVLLIKSSIFLIRFLFFCTLNYIVVLLFA